MKPNCLLLFLIIFSLVLITCDKLEDPPTEGLELHLTFDGNLDDISINKNDGIGFSANNFVKGRWSQALDFNGTSDYIQLSKNIIAENGLSFSFWMNMREAASTENNGSIICKYNMTAHRRSFMVFSFGAFETRNDYRLSAAFYKYNNTSSVHDHVKSYMTSEELKAFPDPTLWTIVKPKRISVNTWTHCVINVTATEVQAWINGELCVKKTREHDLYFDSTDEPIYIGNNLAIGEGSNNHFNGMLDEFRIYNRELSKHEIQILYKNK
jgi:hypothetical protein